MTTKPVKSTDSDLYDVAFRFGIYRIKSGSFKNLWALHALKENGSVDEIIVDADSLQSVIDNLAQVLENRGY